MLHLENKNVLVIGLGGRGQAACELLLQNGARVLAIDSADTPALHDVAEHLRPLGVEVSLGVSALPAHRLDLAVVSPAIPPSHPLVHSVVTHNVPVIGELELGFQQAKCLCIAIAGTNGKSTTA